MIRDTFRKWLGVETRAEPDAPYMSDAWYRAIPPSAFASGGGVESNIPTAHRCVSLQATVLAGLPFGVYERTGDGERRRVRGGSLARLIERPNAWQSRFDLIESIVRALHYQGNYFAEVNYERDGTFASLAPLAPGSVIPETTISGAVRYKVSASAGRAARTLLEGEVLHIRNAPASPTDLLGQSTVASARAALGLAMQLNTTASDLAANGLKAPGFVMVPGRLSQKGRDNVADSIETQPNRAGRVKVLEEGAKWIPTSFSAADAELLNSRMFAAEDTARIFATPPGMVGLQRNSSYGSAAQDAQNFVTTCLGPLANRIEEGFGRCLLSDETRETVFFEVTLDGLLRSDPNERWRSYEIARRIGAMSANDVRRLENLPAIQGGDDYTPTAGGSAASTSEPIASAT